MTYRLTIGLTFAVLGTLFTLFPELLEHSPIGFEERGGFHHLWHYTILIGGLVVVMGAAMKDGLFEAVGLVACGLATLVNLAAVLSAPDVPGMDIAMRVLVLGVIAGRVVEIRKEAR